jgi:hypothetical protein
MTYPAAFLAMDVADWEDNGGFGTERDIVEK